MFSLRLRARAETGAKERMQKSHDRKPFLSSKGGCTCAAMCSGRSLSRKPSSLVFSSRSSVLAFGLDSASLDEFDGAFPRDQTS